MGFGEPGHFPSGQGGYIPAGARSSAYFTQFNFAADVSLTDLTGAPGGMRFTCPNTAGDSWRIAEVAGTTSALAQIRWLHNAQSFGIGESGVTLRNSTSGRLVTWFFVRDTSGSSLSRTSLVLFGWSSPTTFFSTYSPLNPYTLAPGAGDTWFDVVDMPQWLGIKLAGADVECWGGWDDDPTNLFKIATAGGAGTYVSGGGGSMDRVGVGLNGVQAGADTMYAMDVHSFYPDVL